MVEGLFHHLQNTKSTIYFWQTSTQYQLFPVIKVKMLDRNILPKFWAFTHKKRVFLGNLKNHAEGPDSSQCLLTDFEIF